MSLIGLRSGTFMIYAYGWKLGIKLLAHARWRAAANLLIRPVNYWRTIEYRVALGELEVRPGERVLDVGSPKLLSLWLARHGHRVTAVDLSSSLVKKCRQRVSEEKLEASVDCRVADARDLSAFRQWTYDVVLLMGPIYHLVLREDRVRALQESYDRLKPGGILFSAMISRYGIMGHLLRNVPKWIENQKEVRSVIECGHRPEDFPKGGFRGYYVKVDEIAPLYEEVGLQSLVLAGVEPAISADDESYNGLEGSQRELWLDLLCELSRELSFVASSRHLLCIGRKPEQ